MKKGYGFGEGPALAGTTRVAGCPVVSPPVFTPHRALKYSRSMGTSTVKVKRVNCARHATSSLSDGSAAPESLAGPFPLEYLGAIMVVESGGWQKRVSDEQKQRTREGVAACRTASNVCA